MSAHTPGERVVARRGPRRTLAGIGVVGTVVRTGDCGSAACPWGDRCVEVRPDPDQPRAALGTQFFDIDLVVPA